MDTGKKKSPAATPVAAAPFADPSVKVPGLPDGEAAAAAPIKIDNQARRIARLAAVQALYRLSLSGETSTEVIGHFRADPSVLLEEDRSVTAVDIDLCAEIVAGAAYHQADLDALIGTAVSEKLSLARMESLLKSILRAGAYELQHRRQVDTGVIVNDYVEIAHGFFGAKEPGLVNAVLDRLAKSIRV